MCGFTQNVSDTFISISILCWRRSGKDRNVHHKINSLAKTSSFITNWLCLLSPYLSYLYLIHITPGAGWTTDYGKLTKESESLKRKSAFLLNVQNINSSLQDFSHAHDSILSNLRNLKLDLLEFEWGSNSIISTHLFLFTIFGPILQNPDQKISNKTLMNSEIAPTITNIGNGNLERNSTISNN